MKETIPRRRLRAADLKVGDWVDLENDRYADPDHCEPSLSLKLARVISVQREAEDCTAVGFEGFDVVAFPMDHVLAVKRDGSTRTLGAVAGVVEI